MRKLATLFALSLMLLPALPPSVLAQGPAPHFALVDQDGRPVTDTDFAGRYMLIFFGYTHCPDICPTTLFEMATLRDAFPSDMKEKVALMFVTGDPERDTPAVLKTFISYFNNAIIGLSGTTKEVDALAWGLKAVVIRNGQGPADYTVDHSTNYILVHDGVILDQIPNTLTTEELLARIKRNMKG
jgi:protein SCO1